MQCVRGAEDKDGAGTVTPPATCKFGHPVTPENTRYYWSTAKCRNIPKCAACCRARPFSMRRFVAKLRAEK